jgi:protein TonB
VIIKRIFLAVSLCIAMAAAVHSQSAPPPPPPAAETPKQPPDSNPTKDHPVQRVARGGSAEMKDATKRVQPQYPYDARQQGIQGTVRVYTLIGIDGRVIEAKYISGPAALVQATISAVKQWQFKPYLLNGAPVEVESVLDFNFALSR